MLRLSHWREHSHKLPVCLSADVFHKVFSVSVDTFENLSFGLSPGLVIQDIKLLVELIIEIIDVKVICMVI